MYMYIRDKRVTSVTDALLIGIATSRSSCANQVIIIKLLIKITTT